MTTSHNPARLRRFLAQLTQLVHEAPEETLLLERGKVLLHNLVQHDDWLPDAYAQPSPERYQQYLLYADPLERFSVVSFVWGPGQKTPVHNHTVWGLIGLLRGGEKSQGFAQNTEKQWQPQGAAHVLSRAMWKPFLPPSVMCTRSAISLKTKPPSASMSMEPISAQSTVLSSQKTARKKPLSLATATPRCPTSGTDRAKPNRTLPPLIDFTDFSLSRSMTQPISYTTTAQVREALLAKREIALLDVREEDPFAQGHPLFAANLPLGRLELDARWRIPRPNTQIVVYDNGEGLAEIAAQRLQAQGFTQVSLLQGGLQGWRDAGGEIFIDVNVPSKSFGELVESERHTPSLPAPEVKALLDQKADVVVLDARRFDEYQTMNIPGSSSVPGAELVLRARELAPNPTTRIIVNCAGRTRSIIGTQSLVNAGLPNPISALRNGTIGWTLAGQTLEHGADRRAPATVSAEHKAAAQQARDVADKAGVQRAVRSDIANWQQEVDRTTYLLDVRTPEEFTAGHLSGFRSAPGGQLVQETDVSAPVRGARIVLADDDGVRANMTASWLAQMGWNVYVLDGLSSADFSDSSPVAQNLPEPTAPVTWIKPQALADAIAKAPKDSIAVVDLTTSANHVRRHIPGAWFALRTDLQQALSRIPKADRYVLTCGSSLLAKYAVQEFAEATGATVEVLEGGNQAWADTGLPVEAGEQRLASPRVDRYRRPYEGTDNAHEAMQAYLDWEFGLVEQLGRDGTHGFKVI
jgi:rhodanese-related sulfurtransferase/predicted metal-dependent enzyme (double-stranded beta helix superfamily)